jgi:hypothetical protein
MLTALSLTHIPSLRQERHVVGVYIALLWSADF